MALYVAAVTHIRTMMNDDEKKQRNSAASNADTMTISYFCGIDAIIFQRKIKWKKKFKK